MRNVFLAVLLSFTTPAMAFDLEPAPLSPEELAAAEELGISEEEIFQVREPMTKAARAQVAKEIERDAQDLEVFSRRTDKALGVLVKRAAGVLETKGFSAEAEQLRYEYDNFYTNAVFFVYLGVEPVELGDHAPLNQWLADWYNKLEDRLKCNSAPINLCKALHLIDIKVMNYGIPVVFKPSQENTWCLNTKEATCKDDYKLHFAGKPLGGIKFDYFGVSGVVSYWVTWGVCVGATFGAGAIGMICSPIATVVEIGVSKYIAPPISDRIFDRVNN